LICHHDEAFRPRRDLLSFSSEILRRAGFSANKIVRLKPLDSISFDSGGEPPPPLRMTKLWGLRAADRMTELGV
jgi:hypothetical protein